MLKSKVITAKLKQFLFKAKAKMRLFSSVHRKYFKMSSALILLVLVVSSSVTVGDAEPQFSSAGYIDSDLDLLALPSDPQVQRTGPITQYAFDSLPLESQDVAQSSNQAGLGVAVLPPPQSQQSQQQQEDNAQVASSLPAVENNGEQAQASEGQGQIQSESGIPHLPIDGHHFPLLPTGPGIGILPEASAVPVALGHPTTVFVPDEHHAAVVYPSSFLDIYREVLHHPRKAVEYLLHAASSLHIPQHHYMNVISFVGIYLFMSYLFYSTEDVLQLTCEVSGGNIRKGPVKEWAYHAGRRFVPALPVDRRMQKKFLELFKGVHLEGDGSSSSEEDYSGELSHINELSPRGQFFFSLAPQNIEAWTQLQRLFVGVKTPADVLALAKELLHKQKIHPKIWYLGLIAAAMERPDMTGFTLAHPLDAVPDWFIPAHLIKDEFDRYRSITLARQGDRAKRIKRGLFDSGRNATYYVSRVKMIRSPLARTSLGNKTTTLKPASLTTDSGEMSGEFIGLDGSPIMQKSYTMKGDDEELNAKVKKTMSKIDQSRDDKKKKKHHGPGLAHGKKHKKHHKKHHKKGHKGKKDKCIVVDGRVGRDNGVENKLWYWREDLMMNQHHWYWHQMFPLNATRHPDRRAELFFFMHRAFLARYNAERLSNGLPRTHELDFQPGGIIHDGYNSHLMDIASGKWWSPRPGKLPLTDITHMEDPILGRNLLMPDVMVSYHRLLKAAKTGTMVTKHGKLLKIAHTQGIEPFANTVEASELSVNPIFYDAFGVHNIGHQLIAFAADPYYKLHIPPGPMADQSMSMRDPAFYPYHVVIDNLFEKYKATLPPYRVVGGEFPLLWRGIEVHHVEVVSKGHNNINHLRTFWTDRKFPLAPGVDRSVDIADKDHAQVCAVHLAHEPFLFKIAVERKPCAKTKSGKATVRIFMAPRFDEKGRRLHMREQRRMMFQLDSFPVKLRIGKNIITRRSHDSSLTKPWTRSIKEMEVLGQDPSGAADFCGCGWPQHLYIPKGSHDGMLFDLFVMLTNFDEDRVLDNPKDLKFPEPCNSPHIFCGHPRRRYPDARPMGYPFDRPLCKNPVPCFPGHTFGSMLCRAFNLVFIRPVETLEQFVSKAPNMKSTVFTIKHVDHFVGHHH